MKRQDILEIIVSNPQAIFKNSNRDAGKYSEYATYFQVTGVSQDKSSVFTKSVTVRTVDYLKDDKGGFKSVPVHDKFSHGADAARYAALALRPAKAKPDISKYLPQLQIQSRGNQGWMSL